MVEIEIEYDGSLRTRATHGPSRNQLETDAPTDNHGKGERFSPTDLVVAALGSCMLTVMGIVAERHEWSLAGARVRLEKHMVTAPARRIGRIVVEMHLPTSLDEEARTRLERAAFGCPVHHSLHPETEIDARFIYDA